MWNAHMRRFLDPHLRELSIAGMFLIISNNGRVREVQECLKDHSAFVSFHECLCVDLMAAHFYYME